MQRKLKYKFKCAKTKNKALFNIILLLEMVCVRLNILNSNKIYINLNLGINWHLDKTSKL